MSDKNYGIVEGVLPTGDDYAVLIQYVTSGGAPRTGMFSMAADAEVTCDAVRVADYPALADWLARHPHGEVTLNPEPALYGLSRRTWFNQMSVPSSAAAAPGATHASRRQEVVDAAAAFVQRKYAGDWHAAFLAEDQDGDGRISTDELCTILAKSGVGMRLTRWAIALQIITALDADGDNYVSWPEFQSIAHVS